MTSFNLIQIEQKDGVAYVILNNQPANAINLLLLNELQTALAGLEEFGHIKVIVIKSVNERMFSAGADLNTIGQMNSDEMDAFCRKMKSFIIDFHKSSKIYIASIEGHCLGGGLELALGCDLRVAKDASFKMGLPEFNIGLFPNGGGIRLAGSIIGMQKAFRLAAFGETLTAAKAAEWGLVDHLLPQEGYAEKLEQMAKRIAQGPSLAIAKIKNLIYFSSRLDVKEAFEQESLYLKELLVSEDYQEGIQAFMEKRVPQFKGK
jgi:enoyl-CoA hydratase/carnithine racemase